MNFFSGFIWRCEECDPDDNDADAIDPLDKFISSKHPQKQGDNNGSSSKKWKFRGKTKVSYA